MNLHYKPMRRAGILVHIMGDESVLHDEQGRRVHVLNDTARIIWDSCDGATSIDAMVHTVCRTFDGVERGAVASDVVQTVERFLRENLVTETDAQVNSRD